MRALAGLVPVLAVAAACSVAETIAAPFCEGEPSSAIIAAQSVPSATLVGCFEPLPVGWEVARVDIGQNGTALVLDSDRAGAAAARFHFTARCETGDAVQTPTDNEGTERYELIQSVSPAFRAKRYYTFEGGCLWWEFDFDEAAPAALSIELGNSVVLVERQIVSDNVRRVFVDAEL